MHQYLLGFHLLIDYFVNDAFSVAHSSHASVIGLTNYIDIINLKYDSDEIIIQKIKELKKQNYEIMYKNERIKL